MRHALKYNNSVTLTQFSNYWSSDIHSPKVGPLPADEGLVTGIRLNLLSPPEMTKPKAR